MSEYLLVQAPVAVNVFNINPALFVSLRSIVHAAVLSDVPVGARPM
jgi:hypothetical protein